jgi:hypothetical protein
MGDKRPFRSAQADGDGLYCLNLVDILIMDVPGIHGIPVRGKIAGKELGRRFIKRKIGFWRPFYPFHYEENMIDMSDICVHNLGHKWRKEK